MSLPGEIEIENRPSTEAKALRINLNSFIYGTFAEIGAGQEVARQFFRIGGASGTIAKTISAYDKTFSDNIYGEENDKRYVTESRVDKMLDHEIELLETRIRKKNPQKMFFTYANRQLMKLLTNGSHKISKRSSCGCQGTPAFSSTSLNAFFAAFLVSL